MFILAGRLHFGNRIADQYSYARVEAGKGPREFHAGSDGARFLFFVGAPVRYDSGSVDGDGVEVIAMRDVPWKPATTPDVPPGIMTKRLAEDRETGARTWILGFVHWGGDITRWETHPCAEEIFFVEGAMRNGEVFPEGPVMIEYEAGGYFYRPAGIGHSGPGSGTDSYVLAFCRSSGDLTVDWHDDAPSFPDGLDAKNFGGAEGVVV